MKISRDILRAVLGSARPKDVPRAMLGLKKRFYHAISARYDVPPMPREYNPKRHKAYDDCVVPAWPVPSPIVPLDSMEVRVMRTFSCIIGLECRILLGVELLLACMMALEGTII
jgi:hypothetical protein